MYKDPQYTELNPYDFLGVETSRPMLNMHKALVDFMRNNRDISKIGTAQAYIQKLKSAKERIVYDLMYYSLDVIETDKLKSISDFSKILNKMISVPVNNPIDYHNDLFTDGYSELSTDVLQQEKTIREISLYQDKTTLLVQVPMDICL